MKTKYFLILIITLLILIGSILYFHPSKKQCESKTTEFLILKNNPLIKIYKNHNQILISLSLSDISLTLPASSLVQNFFRSINPICSDKVYKWNPKFFKERVCFQAQNYSICRGQKIQKGYMIARKENQKFSSFMYLIPFYPWENIEKAIHFDKNISNPNLQQQLEILFDKRILSLPSRSYVKSVRIENHIKIAITKVDLEKNEWKELNTNRKVENSQVMSLINSILMLERKIDLNLQRQIQNHQISFYKTLNIEIKINFESWRYSIGKPSKYQITFYEGNSKFNKKYYFVRWNQIPYTLISSHSYQNLMQAIKNVNQYLHNQKQRTTSNEK